MQTVELMLNNAEYQLLNITPTGQWHMIVWKASTEEEKLFDGSGNE